MKRKSLFINALNTSIAAINAASGLFQELTLPEGGVSSFRFRLAPYGEFKGKDTDGNDIVQVIDRECVSILAANFKNFRNQLATFFRGIPIYEGHADDPGWSASNPGHKASAVGRIKEFEAGADGIYVTCALNSAGAEMLGGEAPAYTGHSPYWRLAPIEGRPGYFRPVLLWSTALTNMPNIPGNTIALNEAEAISIEQLMELEAKPSPAEEISETENQENNMKITPEALQALGFAPDAEPSLDEIIAAIKKLASDKAEAEAKKVTAEGEVTAANTRANCFQIQLTALEGVRTAAIDTVITEAINTGRITEADKDKWVNALNTDFASESAKLKTLMPTINVDNKVVNIGDRRAPGMVDAANAAQSITDGVRAFASEKGIDVSTNAGWDRAYNECKKAKPELFGK